MAHTTYRSNGKRVPSVTTILGKFKDPGALMYWSWNTAYQVLEEAHELIQFAHTLGPENTSHSLRHSAVANHKRLGEFLNSNPKDRANFRNVASKAANAGTFAHSLVEQWLKGDKAAQSNLSRLLPRKHAVDHRCSVEISEKALNAFHAFLTWRKHVHFVPQDLELQVVSDEYQYGGTIDCVAWIDDELVVFDWKTSKALYQDYLLQVAAYAALWNEHWEPAITIAHIVRFDKESGVFEHRRFDNLETALDVFLSLRFAFEGCKQLDKVLK